MGSLWVAKWVLERPKRRANTLWEWVASMEVLYHYPLVHVVYPWSIVLKLVTYKCIWDCCSSFGNAYGARISERPGAYFYVAQCVRLLRIAGLWAPQTGMQNDHGQTTLGPCNNYIAPRWEQGRINNHCHAYQWHVK